MTGSEPKADTRPSQNFSFSDPQNFQIPHPASVQLARFRIQFGVRSLKPVWILPLAKFGDPIDPSQVRKRFGFGRPCWLGRRKTFRILQVTLFSRARLDCLIIRLSEVRVLVGPPFFIRDVADNMFIERVCSKLTEHNVPYALVGGHAGLYPLNGGMGIHLFLLTRLIMPSHPQWVSTLNR